MITQHYKIKTTLEHIQEAKPGHFVYQDNNSNEIIGFVDFVSDHDLSIILFEQADVDIDGVTNISDKCDYEPRLREILSEDKEIADMWYRNI